MANKGQSALITSHENWLWVVPKWPLPAEDGARQATTQLLSHLVGLGQQIDLLCIVQPDESPELREGLSELRVNRISLIERRTSAGIAARIYSLLLQSDLPVTLAPYGSKSVAARVQGHLENNRTSPVILDGLHAGAWIERVDLGHRNLVYRAHNVERDIWLRAAADTTNPAKSVLLNWQAGKVGRFERNLCQRCQLILPVSDDDKIVFDSWNTNAKAVTIPIGMDNPVIENILFEPGSVPILFVGRLDWPPNRKGLKWFLQKVWGQACARQPGLRLTVIGSGDSSWLKEFTNLPNLSILGRVDRLEPHYGSACASIVPIYFGSGTRVKAIESCLFGKVCISTAMGVEGLGLTPDLEYVRCETADDWIRVLSTLSADNALKLGENARNFVAQRFNARRAAEKMLEAVNNDCLV